jgi:poly(3-hydroxybutyrate) depolymerase
MDVQGTQRDYIVTLPPGYDPNVPYKLVFVWHPLGGNMESIANFGYSGLAGLAAGSAIFATGQGLIFSGTLRGWGNPNDIPFARQLIEHIIANYCVDGERIFSTGFSFGAIMSNRVGCEIGDYIRAIAPMSGGGGGPGCVGDAAVWITHGSADNVVPYDSGLGSLNYWVGANGCSQNTVPTGVDQCVEYQGCRPEVPVVWCPTGLTHTPPSYATTEIWNFFSRF